MKSRFDDVLDSIGKDFKRKIEKGSRHYLEVSLGKYAGKLGYDDLRAEYNDIYAIVPLNAPQEGMKVRIDGRTFVNYAEHESGIAVPGYLAEEAGRSFKSFVPRDSMICNFS